MSLSVIVPVYNEEGSILTILQALEKIKQFVTNIEVIVVDDCSKDSTRKILEANHRLADHIFYMQRNQGKGAAIKIGLGLASQELVLVQDADCEYDPSEIPRLLDIMNRYELDLLTTSRFNGSEFTRVHYFWHKVGNRLITFLFNLFFNTTFTDLYSGYIMFKKSNIDHSKLLIPRWGQQVELIAQIVSKKGLIGETAISYFGRTYSQGKKIRAHSIIGVLLAIFWCRIKKRSYRKNVKI